MLKKTFAIMALLLITSCANMAGNGSCCGGGCCCKGMMQNSESMKMGMKQDMKMDMKGCSCCQNMSGKAMECSFPPEKLKLRK